MVDEKIVTKINFFIHSLKKHGLEISSVYLYGSFALGKAGPDSDIDVAIVSEGFTGNIARDIKTILPALKEADPKIEPVRFRPSDFQDEDPLVWEIKNKGIRVF
jgi:predicted nucleotidyltransferase